MDGYLDKDASLRIFFLNMSNNRLANERSLFMDHIFNQPIYYQNKQYKNTSLIHIIYV